MNAIYSLVRLLIFAALSVAFSIDVDAQERKVIIVVGAAGMAEYGEQFETWANNWESAIEAGKDSRLSLAKIGLNPAGETSDWSQLKAAIESTKKEIDEVWVVLIGHGTDDRTNSKFNLRGQDVTATQLNDWLAPLPCRTILINCASASGGFVNKLKGPNRIVMTATKSPAQYNFARFGQYLSESIADPALDLDKDQQTSLLEAFVAASSRAQEFYIEETRLATELAMIDDNGDGMGTPATWFEGTRVVRKSKTGNPDGFAANQVFLIRRGAEAKLSSEQRKQRDVLEAELEAIRVRRQFFDEDDYLLAIEPVLLKLAKIYESVETASVPVQTDSE